MKGAKTKSSAEENRKEKKIKSKKEGSQTEKKRTGREKQEKITRYTASGEETGKKKSRGRVAVNQREISKKLAERGEKGGDA